MSILAIPICDFLPYHPMSNSKRMPQPQMAILTSSGPKSIGNIQKIFINKKLNQLEILSSLGVSIYCGHAPFLSKP